jgi:ArsR family transcriptional regulator
LFDGERSVGELVVATGGSQANVSKQLAILHRAGWVQRRRAGQSVLYALADERTFALCELMCARVRERAARAGDGLL